jgi:hypothetical protein
MSIGNLKDSGNQGNNLPYQWKVLQGLQAILDEVAQPLTCVEDSVTICNDNIDAFTFTNIAGDDALNVNIAGGVTLEVNLDPDNDSVGIYGYTNPADPTSFTGIKVDADGELQVDVLTMPATFAEDTAHVSGNIGSFILGVRNDTYASFTSNDGDYSPISVDVRGAIAIQDGGDSITVDGTVELGATTLSALESITVQNPGGASAVNIQDGGNSITVDGGTGLARTPNAIRPINTSGTVTGTIYSISVANVGAANGTVLTSVTTIKPGEVLNFSADAINNYFNSFAYNATGTEFIIIYVA